MFTLEVRENPLPGFSQQAFPGLVRIGSKKRAGVTGGAALRAAAGSEGAVQHGWQIVGYRRRRRRGRGARRQ